MAFHYPDHGLAMDPSSAAASSPNPSFSPGGGGGAGVGGGEREKAAVAAHPLYERLLEAHVACLRVATPVDQLPRIDAQIAARPPPLAAASAAAAAGGPSGGEELDLFMVRLSAPRPLLTPLSACRIFCCRSGKRRWEEKKWTIKFVWIICNKIFQLLCYCMDFIW